MSPNPIDEIRSPTEILQERERRERLMHLMKMGPLSAMERAVIARHYFMSMSLSQAAVDLNISKATAHKHERRALRKLQRLMVDY